MEYSKWGDQYNTYALCCCRLFEEIDQDGDNYISPSQLKELLLEMNSTGSSVDKEREIAEVMREFDVNGDQKISKDEFVDGFAKWLHETKHAMDKQYFSRKSFMDVYQVIPSIIIT